MENTEACWASAAAAAGRRRGGSEGGREGSGEGGQDVAFVEVVVKPVRGEEKEVTGFGAEGKELPEFRSVAEGRREGGREGGVRLGYIGRCGFDSRK